jgi:RNA polymerase sigma factor (sigma-70 family)
MDDQLILENQKMVYKIAHSWVGRSKSSFEDLVQAGNVGLLEAAKRYNKEKNKFLTYALWWIRKLIREEALKNLTQVSISVNNKATKTINEFSISEEVKVFSRTSEHFSTWAAYPKTNATQERVVNARSKLEKIFEIITDSKEREVIRKRMQYYTLQEIGTTMNLTRERVRQLEKNAMERVKNFVGEGE